MSARSGLVGQKILPAPFGATWANFLRGPEQKSKKNRDVFAYCLLFYRFGALAAIHPRWGCRYHLCTEKDLDNILVSHICVLKTLLDGICLGSSPGSQRLNRAHWPTKENRQKIDNFWIFPAHAKNDPGGPQMGPGGFFFRLIKTLPTFWAERIWILRFSFF